MLLLTHHTDHNELRRIEHSFANHHKFLYIQQAIKFKLENLYPSVFELFSCSVANGIYWFSWKTHQHVKTNDVFLAYKGEFDVKKFMDAFVEFAKTNKIFQHQILFGGEKMLVDEDETEHSTIKLYSLREKAGCIRDAFANWRAQNDVYLAHNGELNVDYFMNAFVEFAKINKIFQHQNLFIGDKMLVDEVLKYVQDNEQKFVGTPHPTKVFYMTDSQVEATAKLELSNQLPAGYELGSADPLDSEFITSKWRHAKEGDVEETRTKLSLLPSSCIRYEKKPVAFEMLSQSGQLNHLFVVEEHRGQGLGQIVELDLCQKTARNDVYLAYEGEFNVKKFMDAFVEFAKINEIFQHQIMFVGEKMLVDEVVEYVQENEKNFDGSVYPSRLFYMTDSQMEAVEKLDLKSKLLAGYELGSADPLTDSVFITSKWRHAKEGDVEETKTKLSILPTSCIRYEKNPVAFEMLSQSGQLTHSFVVEKHRGQGLGQIVELDLCQKTARFGLRVFKCIEVFNKSLIGSTTRSPLWTKAKYDDDSDFILVYYRTHWR
ncbi:unnamed protein product [Cylicocyclus nassatus]|uniref:Glycine N-acyltransferase-like protein n=1 Tax=Cylicocyclus nassatus TaxID=53992 RepID=A0AA36GJL9_CYLNA|nr:unnamed protein product [Cylicocyclus nassatus]